MRPEWEKGLRGRLYALGRRVVPLGWRRAIRRRIAPERLLGIRKPAVDVPTFDFDPREAAPGRPDVVVLPVVAWSYRAQRPQQLSRALARRGKRVFYGSLGGSGEPPEPTGVAAGITLLPIAGVRREDPGDRLLTGGALEAALGSLARARERFEIHEAALLVQSPYWAPLGERLRERFGWKIVYDCLDEHAGFPANRVGALDAAEREILRSADLVFATSEPLLERLRASRPDARLLGNAADAAFFAALADPAPSAGRLTVGYAGAVDDWFDFDLVAEAARLRPDWRFEIVGGVEGRRPDPTRFPANVAFLGERPYDEMPALRSRFDVEMIPFRLSPLTHATDPVKLYEALAAGRGVVTTPMRALETLAADGLVSFAATPEELVAALDAAAAAGPAEIARRRAFASRNTWDLRAEEVDRLLEDLWPLISILVVTHGELGWTRLCLESLERRTDWPRFEVVVADNASADGTREWLRQWQERRPGRFRTVFLPDNRGFAAGVNAAANASSGDYLCILNNDTIVTRGWLSALVRHLQHDSSLGMVGASTNEVANEARVEVGYRDLAHLDGWARRYILANAGRAQDVGMLAMFCSLVARNTWERVGPLDERFEIGMFEDDDYARRLAAQGLRLAVARDAFVHHAGRGTFRAMPHEQYRRIFGENRRRFEEKWSAPPRAAAPAGGVDEVRRRAEEAGAVFVFPPSIGWDVALVQRPHHLARAFARLGFPVVFEEEAENGGPAAATGELTLLEENLWLSKGPIDRAAPFPNRVSWAFGYNVPTTDAAAGARLVYDVIDHPDVFPHPRRLLLSNEERALERADAVFAVSRPLLARVLARRTDATYLPNGVEFERFAAPADPAAVPDEISRARSEGRPAAGYVGALARWVDSDLLAALAELRPDWDFFLVGDELDDSFRRFDSARPSNLHLLGPRPYSSIPSILSGFDAGLIPFRTGPEGSNASPIKLYEYLAAGLPVLSTPIPECEAVPEVEVAASAFAFSDLLDRARGSRRSEAFARLARDRARQNDWSARARTALARLGLSAGVG